VRASIRIKFELEGVSEEIPILKGKAAIYWSRIGVYETRRSFGLGRVLREYFFHICRSEAVKLEKPLWIYLKTRDKPEMILFSSLLEQQLFIDMMIQNGVNPS
jgi:GNAT superfamily N-acetyltransferase